MARRFHSICTAYRASSPRPARYGAAHAIDALEASDANQGIFAFNVTTLREQRPDWYQADLTALFALLEQQAIAPLVAGRLDLAQAAEAHRRIERADVIGKLVLVPQGAVQA